MSTAWLKDGTVERQIEESLAAAVERARGRLLAGESLARCEKCGGEIPEERRTAIPGVRRCVRCQANSERQA